ncbi:MAG: hemD [Paenibacillus sp.]|jgi:uroporphyrinogen-III synthase|nr:hemD [Paenibacillus sp.]
MNNKLNGKRIVIAGSRKTEEVSSLIQKQGGIPIIRSLQGLTFFSEKELEHEIVSILQQGADWVVFTTGTGTEAILDVSEKLNIRSLIVREFREAKVAVRGYKTYSLLKNLGIIPDVMDEDGTTVGLIKSLESYDFTQKRVLLQLHGEKVPSLTQFFESKGAILTEILPYRHTPPSNETLELLNSELLEASIYAVCFTTAVQVRYLFEYARKKGIAERIRHIFDEEVVAAAVGRVTADALKTEGVKRVVSPEHERMGAMIVELARFGFDQETLKEGIK